MARCDNCLANKVCDHHRFGFENCGSYISAADVAPKSEVEALGREVERLTNILNSYALQYGTVKDQHEVIDKAKAEAVKEFAEYLKKYYRHIDKTAGALIEYTIDKKVKAFLGKEGVDDD